ncbi:MAG: helix-turn-helix domain-containing protein [Candidatus Promineifilaceae bacterium]|nr:helix-turn-helix domain-containing protein [Candidatus Promineifilaceae bacterium]
MEVNLGDVLRLALPLKTSVVGGASEARRAIRWVALLTSWSDLSDQVAEEDLVIVPLHLQEQLTIADFCSRLALLASLHVSAIIVFRNVPSVVEESASKNDLPLVIVPSGSSLRETHQAIAALLVDRQQATSERSMQLYRRLSEMSREGQGLQAMTDVMANLTGKIVIVQDKRLEIKAGSWPSNAQVDQGLLQRAIKQRDQLPEILLNRKAAARARQSYWQQILPIKNMGRLISPIISGDRARGYLSVIGPAERLDLLDSLTVEQGAAACALEMAKAKAVSEARKALRGDFLEGLLAGNLPPEEIDRLASRLDHDTRQPHAVLALSWIGTNSPSLRRLETTVNWLLNNHTQPALVHDYGGQFLCVFQALKESDRMEPAYEFNRRLTEQVSVEFPDANLIGGMSGPANTLEDWPRVYREALQAMDVGERLQLGRQIVEFNSLGVYQLLCELENIEVVENFTKQIIAPLANYDKEHRGSLIQTLEAYFNHHGNISRTAESLFVHRNTLLYRMDRIQELTGQDLDNANTRLALHLSLKLWQLRRRR